MATDLRTNCSKPRIVHDLIPVILECNDHWWARDFQRLALVSSGWLGPIRRRLYRCPTLRTFRACSLFARTVKENHHILSLIEGVNLSPVIPSGGGFAPTEGDMAGLRFILSLKKLQTVVLGGELAVQADRFLQMMSNTRSITSLHIDGSYIQQQNGFCCRVPASLEWGETLAYRFTKLRRLRLTGLELSVREPSMPYSIHLDDITLEDVVVMQGSLQHLCNESWDTVRRVSVVSRAADGAGDIVRELMECCENLESVHYEDCGRRAQEAIFTPDLPMPRLRKVYLYDVDVNPGTLAGLSAACQGIEDLAVLGRAIHVQPQEWEHLLRSGALPYLRGMHVSSGTNQPPSGYQPWAEEGRKMLEEACASRNIALRFCPS